MNDDYIDLNDLKGNELKKWRKALENEGVNFEFQRENDSLMIPEYDFKNYAEELAIDTGAIDSEFTSNWPGTHIDWESAATELRMDFSEIEVEGRKYLYRTV